MKMVDKKGQQMTLATIIAIVLGLVVLVFLIYGFSTGWGNLWERITGLGGGNVNVDVIVTSCTLACQQELSYKFCEQVRTVVVEGGAKNVTVTCNDMTKEINFSDGKMRNVGVESCGPLCSS